MGTINPFVLGRWYNFVLDRKYPLNVIAYAGGPNNSQDEKLWHSANVTGRIMGVKEKDLEIMLSEVSHTVKIPTATIKSYSPITK